MKSIQVPIDERLLRELDADPDVQREGRVAVMQRAVEFYLRERRNERQFAGEIVQAYRKGYGINGGIEPEFESWTDQGTWPED